MEALIKDPTSYTPKVVFDPQNEVFEISGDSRPENTHSFYEELIEWLVKYEENMRGGVSDKKPMTISFLFDYLNSSSSKFILKVILKLKNISSETPVQINWHYEEPDIDMKEMGEEFSQMAEMDIKLVQVEI